MTTVNRIVFFLAIFVATFVVAEASCPQSNVDQDLVIVGYKDVMTPGEAKTAGFFNHKGRWLKKRWRKKVKKWKRLDKKHSDWNQALRQSTKHYRVVTNLPNHILESEIAPFLDAQFRAYTRYFKAEFGMSAKSANMKFINIHKSIEDYAQHTNRSVQKARYNPGFIAGGSELTVYYDERDPDIFYGTVMHEGAHQFIKAIFPGAIFPKWLNEGLATYFEGCSYSRSLKKFTIGDLPMARLASARLSLKRKPNASMMELFMGVPDVKFGAREYALSWSFLHFLMHGDGGKYKKSFVKFLKKMNGAGVKHSAAEIFEKISRVAFTDLEESWKTFLLGQETKNVPFWVVLTGDAKELATLGIRPRDRVTHFDGIRVKNSLHFNELWKHRESEKATNLIVRGERGEGAQLRGIRVPSGELPSLQGHNSISRWGSLRD